MSCRDTWLKRAGAEHSGSVTIGWLSLAGMVCLACTATSPERPYHYVPESAPPYVQEVMVDRPTVYWQMSSGGELRDGVFGDGAVKLRPDQVRRLTGLPDRETHALTVELWVRAPHGRILAYTGGGGEVWLALTHEDSLVVQIGEQHLETGVVIGPDWHHLALGWSARDGRVSLWLDGLEAWSTRVESLTGLAGDGELFVGPGSTTIDELAWFERRLPAHRIMSHFAVGRGRVPPSETTPALRLAPTGGGHTGDVTCLDFQPGGRLLASGSADRTVRLWDVERGRQLGVVGAHDTGVRALAFAPDGRTLASGGEDEVRVWDLTRWEPISTLSGKTEGAHPDDATIHVLGFSPRMEFLAAGIGEHVVVWELVTGDEVQRLDAASTVRALAWGPLGETLVVGTEGGTLSVWEPRGGRRIWSAEARSEAIVAVDYSRSGRRLMTASATGIVQQWGLREGEVEWSSDDGMSSSAVALHPDGTQIVLFDKKRWSSDDSQALFLNIRSGDLLARPPIRDEAHFALFSDDGRWLAAGSGNGVRLWEVSDGLETHQVHRRERTPATLASTSRVALGGAAGEIAVWQLESGLEPRYVPASDPVDALAWSVDRDQLAAATRAEDADAVIELWGAESSEKLGTLDTASSHPVVDLDFSADGSVLVSTPQRGWPRAWDVDARARRSVIRLPAVASTLSPAGDMAVFTTSTGDMAVIDTKSGEVSGRLRKHSESIREMDFASRGEWLLTASSSEVFVWSATESKLLRTLECSDCEGLAGSPTEPLFAVRDDEAVTLRELPDGDEVWARAIDAEYIRDLAFDSVGSRVAVTDSDGVAVLETQTGDILDRLALDAGDIQWHGDMVAFASSDRRLGLWEPESDAGPNWVQLGGGADIGSFALSSDGAYVYANDCYRDGTWPHEHRYCKLTEWDVTTGERRRALTGSAIDMTHHDIVLAPFNVIASLPTSGRVVDLESGEYVSLEGYETGFDDELAVDREHARLAVSDREQVMLWRLDTGERIGRIPAASGAPRSPVYHPDGGTVAYGVGDRIVFADATTGAETSLVAGHPVRVLAFSADGRAVVAGSPVSGGETTISIWDASTFEPLHTASHAAGGVDAIEVSTDLSTVVTSTGDGLVTFWNLERETRVGLVYDGVDWAFFTEDGYFAASPGGGALVTPVAGLQALDLEQLALVRQRPDIILERLGVQAPDVMEQAHIEVKSHLAAYALAGAASRSSLVWPTAEIVATRPVDRWLELVVDLRDDIGLHRYELRVDGVLKTPPGGVEISRRHVRIRREVALEPGESVEVRALNVRGVWSPWVVCAPTDPARRVAACGPHR